ncbi:MAG: hypothetical protein QF704_00065 [Anaerolineales bacterium]|jgi:hypothetical protein|nr:hypothetical protein [Anaerolineales bacterium]
MTNVDEQLKEAILGSRRTLIALFTPFIAIGLEYVVQVFPWMDAVESGDVSSWVVGIGIAWIIGRSIRNTPV